MRGRRLVSGLAAMAALVLGCGAPRPRIGEGSVELDLDELDRVLGLVLDGLLSSVVDVHGDRALGRYVEGVGRRVVRGADLPAPGSWTFRVLDHESPAAQATPGGYVYVSRGLLAHLGSEAELAAVLGHEIAHVAVGHASGTRDSLPVSVPLDPGSLWSTLEHGTDQEREADQLAVRYLALAGYEPRAMLDALAAVERASPGLPADSAPEDEHPPTATRLALVSRCLDGRRGGEVGHERYMAAVDGLLVGPDPGLGYLEGRRFVLPRAGLSFELPEGFRVEGPSLRVLLVARSGDGALSIALTRYTERGAELLGEALLAEVRGAEHRETTLAGMAAVVGSLGPGWHDVGTEGGRAPAVVLPETPAGVLVLQVAGRPPTPCSPSEVLHDLVRSIRIEERAPTRAPRRLRVVAPEPGQTLRQVVTWGCPGPGRLRQVSRLSGLAADAPLPSGRLVPCVVEER